MEPRSVLPVTPAPGFRDPVAVEVWDACFRWREQGVLRDATVGATWGRVVAALARDDDPPAFARALSDALAWLRLLPDARVLARVGTGQALPAAARDGAVVNAAAFVRDPFGERARLDTAGISATAGLAVRMLDRLRASAAHAGPPALRIGVVGVADAIARLGLTYDGAAAREVAARIGAALAVGSLEASLAAVAAGAPAVARRALPAALSAELRHRRCAHASLTAIGPQPLLALLADNVADALDPRDFAPRAYRIAAPGGERVVRSSGGSTALARELGANLPAAPWPSGRAQSALRDAIAPWVDAPIDYPFAAPYAGDELRVACASVT
jgi:ribonucleoside-diphosphate reductase alpha chain